MAAENSGEIASTNKRMVSFFIDDIVISLFFLIIFYDQMMGVMQGISLESETGLQSMVEAMNLFISENIIMLFALKILYHTVLVWKMGMTLGKYVMKIEVIHMDTHERPDFYRSLTRAVLRLPSEIFFYLGFVMAFFTPLKQTFHDKYSRCVVVNV